MKQLVPRFVKRAIKRWFMTPMQHRAELVGPPELWEMKRQFQIDFLKSVRCTASPSDRHWMRRFTRRHTNCRILNVGCYTGIEAHNVLEEGKQELAKAGLNNKGAQLIVAQHLDSLKLNQMADFIWAFSVLIHLEDSILSEVLGFVSRHLSPDGVFYANVDTELFRTAGGKNSPPFAAL